MHHKTIVAAIASNKIGKSCAVSNILISWLLGYEPWRASGVSHGDDWVKVGDYWFRGSSLGIKPPVNIILTGEDWKLHIGRVLVPEIDRKSVV